MSSDEPATGSALTIALAPTSPIVMAGASALLRAADRSISVVDLVHARAGRVDLVLYDPLDGPPAALAGLAPDRRPGLVGFSWSVRSDVIGLARSHGAVGLLAKGLDARRLASAVREVHDARGRGFVLASDEATVGERSRRADGLTPREVEILELITEGLGNEDIAATLYLSVNSVKTHIRGAYRKIGVTRRPQAVLWGARQGFGDLRAPRARL